MNSMQVFIARRALALAVVGIAVIASPAQAQPGCRAVHGRFDIHPASPCASPVGICSQGSFRGGLRGAYTSPFTSLAPSDIAGVLFFGAEAHLPEAELGGLRGSLMFKEAGSFNTLGGEFAELLSVAEGSGDFEGATGVLSVTGAVDATLEGGGVYDGFVCVS